MELKVSNICKTFRTTDGEPDFTLEIPDLAFELGKLTFIMGHNGSGKSVFLRLLAGDLVPDNGAITLSFERKSWKTYERSAAIVRQKAEDNLALALTVRENLAIRERGESFLDSVFPNRRNLHYEALLREHSELLKKLDQPCQNLSAGQKQTLSFVAVASRNKILLTLDEFLSSTDQKTYAILRRMAKVYAQEGPACVLVVSHDIRLALQDADRILVLKGGRLTADLARDSTEWNEENLALLLA